MLIIGVDPGVHGSICTLDINSGAVQLYDIPTIMYATSEGKKYKVIDEDKLLILIRNLASPHVAFVIIEYQQAFFKGSRSSTFKIADCFGLLRGMFLSANFNLETVKPREWKKNYGLIKTDEMTQSAVKEMSRQKALKLFPAACDLLKRKLDHNRAESILVAEWGRKHILRKYVPGYNYHPFTDKSKAISNVFGEEICRSTTF